MVPATVGVNLRAATVSAAAPHAPAAETLGEVLHNGSIQIAWRASQRERTIAYVTVSGADARKLGDPAVAGGYGLGGGTASTRTRGTHTLSIPIYPGADPAHPARLTRLTVTLLWSQRLYGHHRGFWAASGQSRVTFTRHGSTDQLRRMSGATAQSQRPSG
jgi:hypothetical protein